MEYTDFTLEMVVSRFNLDIFTAALFPPLEPMTPTNWLTETLERGTALALLTEKARSEFIVAPILLTVRGLSQNRVSIYSGHRFDIDAASGLVGECDFILSAAEPVPLVRSPIISVIEAKRGDLELDLGQCAAQMVATQRFNERNMTTEIKPVYGCVTTGREWQFMRLSAATLTFDAGIFYLDNVDLLLAAFQHILRETVPNYS